MMTEPIETVVKMMEFLPEENQNRIVDKLRQYIDEIQDEMRWDSLFKKSQKNLIAAAKQARLEIAEGKSKPMDYDKL